MWACTVVKAPWNTIRCIITFACTATLGEVRCEHASCGNFQCSALVDFIPPKNSPESEKWGSYEIRGWGDELSSGQMSPQEQLRTKPGTPLDPLAPIPCNPAPLHERTQYNSIEMLSSVRNLKLQLAVASTWFNRTLWQINLHRDEQNGLFLCNLTRKLACNPMNYKRYTLQKCLLLGTTIMFTDATTSDTFPITA